MREKGAMALADGIRRGCAVTKLYFTGNRLGPDGMISVTEAILEDELRRIITSYGVNDTRGSDPRALFRRSKHGTDGLPCSCYNALNVRITQN